MGGETTERGPELPSTRIRRDLARRIAADEWRPGQMLPSVADFAEHYGASRSAVNRALHSLAEDSLLTIIPRWGTFRAGDRQEP